MLKLTPAQESLLLNQEGIFQKTIADSQDYTFILNQACTLLSTTPAQTLCLLYNSKALKDWALKLIVHTFPSTDPTFNETIVKEVFSNADAFLHHEILVRTNPDGSFSFSPIALFILEHHLSSDMIIQIDRQLQTLSPEKSRNALYSFLLQNEKYRPFWAKASERLFPPPAPKNVTILMNSFIKYKNNDNFLLALALQKEDFPEAFHLLIHSELLVRDYRKNKFVSKPLDSLAFRILHLTALHMNSALTKKIIAILTAAIPKKLNNLYDLIEDKTFHRLIRKDNLPEIGNFIRQLNSAIKNDESTADRYEEKMEQLAFLAADVVEESQLEIYLSYCKKILSNPNNNMMFATTFIKEIYENFREQIQASFATCPELLAHSNLLLVVTNTQVWLSEIGNFLIKTYPNNTKITETVKRSLEKIRPGMNQSVVLSSSSGSILQPPVIPNDFSSKPMFTEENFSIVSNMLSHVNATTDEQHIRDEIIITSLTSLMPTNVNDGLYILLPNQINVLYDLIQAIFIDKNQIKNINYLPPFALLIDQLNTHISQRLANQEDDDYDDTDEASDDKNKMKVMELIIAVFEKAQGHHQNKKCKFSNQDALLECTETIDWEEDNIPLHSLQKTCNSDNVGYRASTLVNWQGQTAPGLQNSTLPTTNGNHNNSSYKI